MLKIGMRHIPSSINEKELTDMYAAGLRVVEFGIFSEPEKFDFEEKYNIATKCNIEVTSCHLPYKNESHLVQKEKAARARAVEIDRDLINKATAVGINRFVLHPSTLLDPEIERTDCKKYSMDALDNLAEYAYAKGAVIAVEDMIVECLGNCADELAELISVNDKLRICFDVNHILKNTHLEFIEKFKEKIVTVHISDYDRICERHWLPGEGVIDFHELYTKLIQVGYSGPWMYEIGLAKNSKRSRDLTYTDVYNNAMEIFEGKKLTVY